MLSDEALDWDLWMVPTSTLRPAGKWLLHRGCGHSGQTVSCCVTDYPETQSSDTAVTVSSPTACGAGIQGGLDRVILLLPVEWTGS